MIYLHQLIDFRELSMENKQEMNNKKMVTLIISIENDVLEQIKSKAAKLDMTRLEYITKILHNHDKISF